MPATTSALPYIIPATAAILAYLNARHAVTHDLRILHPLITTYFAGLRKSRRDELNFFYTLEAHATSSATRARSWIIHEGESWTYAEAYEIVLKYGTWLKSKGVRKEEVVAVDFVNSQVFIWVWFGLWSIGAKPAFINSNLSEQGLIHCVRASGAKLVLVDENGRDRFDEEILGQNGFMPVTVPEGGREQENGRATYRDKGETLRTSSLGKDEGRYAISGTTSASDAFSASFQRSKLELVFFDKRLENHILSLKPTRQPDSERGSQQMHDMALLIYTSGTSGLPKPAIMSWKKTNFGAKLISAWLGLKKTDIMHTSMPLYHGTAAVLGVGPVLHAGGAICISKKFSHKTLWPEIRASKATIVQYVGETCRYMLSAPPSPLDKQHNVRAAFGNGLRPDVWQPFKDRFNIPTIYEFYSASEAPSALLNASNNAFTAGAFSWNGTLANWALLSKVHVIRIQSASLDPIRDPKTQLCQPALPNRPGELLFVLDANDISADYQGYYGNAAATHSKILRNVKHEGDAYFRSSDLVRRDEEGRWFFVDRLGDTFRWKANDVSTAQVADVLGGHAAIHEANVYGVLVPHHDGRAGCAAVVMTPNAKVGQRGPKSRGVPLPDAETLRSLAEFAKERLPGFAVPVWVRVTGKMHVTGTNKQQKHVFQKEGINVEAVEAEGDALFILDAGRETYRRFTRADLKRIRDGHVKL